MKKLLTTLTLCLVTGVVSAQSFTQSVGVRSVETLTGAERTFIRSAGGGWGHPDCAAAEFVNLDAAASPSYTAQLAIALTAQASGGTIAAFGTCSPNGQVVIAERLRLG